MAASATQIANLALAKLGKKRIESLTEESTEAQWANELYPHCRDFVTEAALWRHSKTTLTLEQVTNALDDDWGYAYQRPSDCLSFRLILGNTGAFDPGNPIRFMSQGDVIYTDEASARGVYAKQVSDVTKFAPSFTECVSWYLAHYLVQPLRLENKLFGDMLGGFNNALGYAIARGDAEHMLIKTADEGMPDWQRAR